MALMKFLDDRSGVGAELFLTNASFGKKISKFKADYPKSALEHGFGRCEFHIHPQGVTCPTPSGGLSRREKRTLNQSMNSIKYEESEDADEFEEHEEDDEEDH